MREHHQIIVDYGAQLKDQMRIEIKNLRFHEDVSHSVSFNLLSRRWTFRYNVFKDYWNEDSLSGYLHNETASKVEVIPMWRLETDKMKSTWQMAPERSRGDSVVDRMRELRMPIEDHLEVDIKKSVCLNAGQSKEVVELQGLHQYAPDGNFVLVLEMEMVNDRPTAKEEFKDGYTQPESSLGADWLKLYTEGKKTDVTFVVQDVEFPAHRLVVGARCGVPLLHDDMMEGKDGARVEIQGTSPQVFDHFLKFLYSDVLSDDVLGDDTLCLGLLELADKYDVDRLVKMCHNSVLSKLNVDNVCQTLENAAVKENSVLFEPCISIFRENLTKVMDTEGYELLQKRRPYLALQLIEKSLGVKRKEQNDPSTDHGPGAKRARV